MGTKTLSTETKIGFEYGNYVGTPNLMFISVFFFFSSIIISVNVPLKQETVESMIQQQTQIQRHRNTMQRSLEL